MEEIIIYKFQLEDIREALRITSNIHHSHNKKTAHDRMVTKSLRFAENALEGRKDDYVPHM